MNKQDVLAALLRSDLRFFIRKVFHEVEHGKLYLPNWNVDAIVHQLMLVQSGKVTRLLVNQPPRSLKSICISVAFVAWLLGSVGIQDSHADLVVIQALDGPIRFD